MSAGQETQQNFPAFGRRTGADGDRHPVCHPQNPSHALLYSRRDRSGARRRQRRSLRLLSETVRGGDAVHRHHPPQADDESGGFPVRRHHAGEGNFQTRFRQTVRSRRETRPGHGGKRRLTPGLSGGAQFAPPVVCRPRGGKKHIKAYKNCAGKGEERDEILSGMRL